MLNVSAKITGIKYTPLLCRTLNTYPGSQLETALTKDASFFLDVNGQKIALSWWVSAKRTRSYPYARVYDTLQLHSGKKVTIIPVMKDEGIGGDRDFLQWDTISLMSLLGIYVIIGYYKEAKQSGDYNDKITEQRFDTDYVRTKIGEILQYQSDALHWNMMQVDELAAITKKAREAYAKISKKTGVKMHSEKGVEKRIKEIAHSKESFMNFSRNLAKTAQNSESRTRHEKEKLSGGKGKITITNYLGGVYYFTADELKVRGKTVYLIEGKNTEKQRLPAMEDIKDGLLKMVIFCNLQNVSLNGKIQSSVAALKLTSTSSFDVSELSESQKKMLDALKAEARENGFSLLVNDVTF